MENENKYKSMDIIIKNKSPEFPPPKKIIISLDTLSREKCIFVDRHYMGDLLDAILNNTVEKEFDVEDITAS